MGYADCSHSEDWEKTAFRPTEKSQSIIVGDFDMIPLLDASGMFGADIAERKTPAAGLRSACTTLRIIAFHTD